MLKLPIWILTVCMGTFVFAEASNVSAQRYSRATRPAVAGVTSARHFIGARPTAARASGAGLQRALMTFSVDMGRMPTGAEGLNALLVRPPGARNWRGPYISTNNWRAALADPWGTQYRYVVMGTGRQAIHYITSNGPDRKPGTRDDLSVQF